jgi:hypothetical protein
MRVTLAFSVFNVWICEIWLFVYNKFIFVACIKRGAKFIQKINCYFWKRYFLKSYAFSTNDIFYSNINLKCYTWFGNLGYTYLFHFSLYGVVKHSYLHRKHLFFDCEKLVSKFILKINSCFGQSSFLR